MTSVGAAVAPTRTPNVWILGGLVFFLSALGAWWSMAPYLVGVFHDDGIYALLARSIAEGRGFHYLHLPGLPAAPHYPPLYPLLLAAIWKIAPEFPSNLPWLLAPNAVLVGIAATGWYVLATQRLMLRPRSAAPAALIVALSSPMLMLAGALLSEMMFIALMWPALLACERALENPTLRSALVAGLLMGAIMLVRAHALAMLIAYAMMLVVRRRPRVAWLALAAAIAVQLPWVLWSAWASPHLPSPLEGAYGSYIGWFVAGLREGGGAFLLGTVRVNLRELWLLLNDRFALGLGAAAQYSAAAVVLAALVIGATSSVGRAPVSVMFAVVYFAVVLVWPWAPWRFAWALWPMVALTMIEGFRQSRHRWPRARPIFAISALFVAFAFARTELHSYATRGWRAPARAAEARIKPLVEWTRANTLPGDVILSEGEQVVYLYTGRQAAPPVEFTAVEYIHPRPLAASTQLLASMLQVVPAAWVVTGSPEVAQEASAMRDARFTLRPVVARPGVAAFRVVR